MTEKLPFDDSSVDVIYHSHFLEHIPLNLGKKFLKENFRILRKGGRLRIVVPDLEEICHAYLDYLDNARKSMSKNDLRN